MTCLVASTAIPTATYPRNISRRRVGIRKMSNITCEFIATSRSIDRAVIAEELRRTHTLTKCNKCEKYHNWIPGTVSDQVRASIEARMAFYVQVGPNRYEKVNSNKKKKEANSE